MDLTDKVAAVTGAGSGTGRAIAQRLGAESCAVVVADLEADPGLNTVRLIEKAGGRAVWVRTDVRIDSDCQSLVAMAESTYGGLDILVIAPVGRRARTSPMRMSHTEAPLGRSHREHRLNRGPGL